MFNDMVEIWHDIEGYENYQVSNMGRVKSLNYNHTGKEKIMKAKKDKGYFRVQLYKDGKPKFYSVHRLVATSFLPNPNNLSQVNHIDEDKSNNIVDNLEWCSAKYNSNYGTRIQRIVEKNNKQVLCVETGVVYTSTMQVEREIGFLQCNISKACCGKYKTAYGFHWRYID
jgi:hypothetical protein